MKFLKLDSKNLLQRTSINYREILIIDRVIENQHIIFIAQINVQTHLKNQCLSISYIHDTLKQFFFVNFSKEFEYNGHKELEFIEKLNSKQKDAQIFSLLEMLD